MFARQTPRNRKRPPVRRWRLGLYALCLGLSFTFAGLASMGLWILNEMRALERLGRESIQAYAALNAEFAFFPPPLSTEPPPERVAAYLRARRSVMERITPEQDRLAVEALKSENLKDAQIFGSLRRARGFLKESAAGHAAALRRERMSLDEFLWIHGLFVREALSTDSPLSRGMAETLGEIERIARSSAAEGEFRPAGYGGAVERCYQGWPALPPRSLEGFDSGTTLGGLLDLLAANRAFLRDPDLHSNLEPVMAPMPASRGEAAP